MRYLINSHLNFRYCGAALKQAVFYYTIDTIGMNKAYILPLFFNVKIKTVFNTVITVDCITFLALFFLMQFYFSPKLYSILGKPICLLYSLWAEGGRTIVSLSPSLESKMEKEEYKGRVRTKFLIDLVQALVPVTPTPLN